MNGALRKLLVVALVLLALIWVSHFLRFLFFVTVVALLFVLLVRAIRWFDRRYDRAEDRAVSLEIRRMRQLQEPFLRMDRRVKTLERIFDRVDGK